MSIDLLLKSHLKTLKLPTILQEYARAARQCAQEDRSFEDFLHYLVELEVAQRQRKTCQRRLKEAGFPTEKEIVIVNGQKMDEGTIFADLISVQNNKIYTKLSQIKNL